MQDRDHRNAIDRLPDDLDGDDAVDYHAFADVPGTTLTVYFTEDADSFDVSRVVSLVDGHGYDLTRMNTHDGEVNRFVVAAFDRGGA